MDPNAGGKLANPIGAVAAGSPVVAVQQSAQIAGIPIPQGQNSAQFTPLMSDSSLAQQPITEASALPEASLTDVSPSVAPLASENNTINDLLAKGPQAPADRLRQEIAASVEAFLAEVTKEGVAA